MRAIEEVEAVREWLRKRSGTYPRIAEDTGISYQWICSFSQGVINDPRVST